MKDKVLGILVGGGPAPGINGVIGAATIRAVNSGFRVLGIYDGYAGLMGKQSLECDELRIEDVSRIHFLGGSILRTDRANPVKEGVVGEVVERLRDLGVTHLLTIGGDDTASVAGALGRAGGPRVLHAPKTIDNDLPLPPGVPTFGFQTACQLGGELAKNLMADAYVAKRWFFVEAMGRKAGHLALGIGKSAGAPLILIPEAFEEGTDVALIVDLIVGSILKRLAEGRPDGLLIYTEGLPEKLDPRVVELLIGEIPRDAHGNPRWSEVDFPAVLKRLVLEALGDLGIERFTITNERIGYTLRCADPVPADRELSRDLGLTAVDLLREGESHGMVTIQGDEVKCIPFREMIDKTTGRARVRFVNTAGYPYQVARHLMIRLEGEDLQGEFLQRLAALTDLSPEGFEERFSKVVGRI